MAISDLGFYDHKLHDHKSGVDTDSKRIGPPAHRNFEIRNAKSKCRNGAFMPFRAIAISVAVDATRGATPTGAESPAGGASLSTCPERNPPPGELAGTPRPFAPIAGPG